MSKSLMVLALVVIGLISGSSAPQARVMDECASNAWNNRHDCYINFPGEYFWQFCDADYAEEMSHCDSSAP